MKRRPKNQLLQLEVEYLGGLDSPPPQKTAPKKMYAAYDRKERTMEWTYKDMEDDLKVALQMNNIHARNYKRLVDSEIETAYAPFFVNDMSSYGNDGFTMYGWFEGNTNEYEIDVRFDEDGCIGSVEIN